MAISIGNPNRDKHDLALRSRKRAKLRAVFFGTPNYATTSIRALLDSRIEVPLICTRPPRRTGRGRVSTPTQVADFGEESGIPVIAPERLDADAVAEISATEADVYVVVAYGRFIPSALLAQPRLGVVNIHPSLLPRHRGPSPVATAILEGDLSTGVTVMMLDEGMDTGPILAQSSAIEISPDVRCDELTAKLFEVGSLLLPEALIGLDSGRLKPVAQDDAGSSITRLIKKEDGEIDWRVTAEQIVRMYRAYHPWPGTSTVWSNQSFKIIDAEVGTSIEDASPGTVFSGDERGVFVAAGAGTSLRLIVVQAAGRRAIPAEDFARGRPDFVGSRLGAQLATE